MYYLSHKEFAGNTYFYNFNIIAVQNKDLNYGVIDINGNVVMDFTRNYYYSTVGDNIIRYEIQTDNYDSNTLIITNAQIINTWEALGSILCFRVYNNNMIR